MNNLKLKLLGVVLLVGLALLFYLGCLHPKTVTEQPNPLPRANTMTQEKIINLPKATTSKMTLEDALQKRRSERAYLDQALNLKDIAQILWAAQGVTESSWGGRTVPSAGALYPIEIYLVVRKVEKLEPGVYHYLPTSHQLNQVLAGDVSNKLAPAAFGQSFISQAAANLVIVGVFERTTSKYGERGNHYVYMEAGHAAQNVYLQATSLNLGTVSVGAFSDEAVQKLLNLDLGEIPLYIMPIGIVTN